MPGLPDRQVRCSLQARVGRRCQEPFSKFLRRTRYLFHNESGSLCFLLGHLLHFDRLRELLAEGQMGLQGRNQTKSTPLTVYSSTAATHAAPRGRQPASISQTGMEMESQYPLKEQKLGQAGLSSCEVSQQMPQARVQSSRPGTTVP